MSWNEETRTEQMELRRNKADPFFHSTESWKTERQWKDLGYSVKDGCEGLLGYASGYCAERVRRFHRFEVRKDGKCQKI